jgi:hypothetical protein
VRGFNEGKAQMEQSTKDIIEAALSRLEQSGRETEELCATDKGARKKFLQALLGGPDMLSWVTPCDDVVGEEVLAEHFKQIRNVVRFALSHALDDRRDTAVNLNAASTAARLIRTNIALAKALGVTANSKTVRGVRPRKDPQD